MIRGAGLTVCLSVPGPGGSKLTSESRQTTVAWRRLPKLTCTLPKVGPGHCEAPGAQVVFSG